MNSGVRTGSGRWELLNTGGIVVGRLAKGFEGIRGMQCASGRVLAVVAWGRDKSEPEFREDIRSETWEVVVPELIFEPDMKQ